MCRRSSSFIWAALIVAVPCAAHAQSPADPVPTPVPPAQAAPANPWKFVWEEHPSIRWGTFLRLDVRATVQGDILNAPVTPRGPDDESWHLTRRRIGFDATVWRRVDFHVERELETEIEPWREVWGNFRPFEALQLRGGRFKLPMGLDQHTDTEHLDFVHRSRAGAILAPGRDRGVMLHGGLLSRRVFYEIGVFDHDGHHARTEVEGRVRANRTVAGRIRVRPLAGVASGLADLEGAVAFTTSEVEEGQPAVGGFTALGLPFFSTSIWVNGKQRRSGLEARWRPGPFGAQAEYIRLTTERVGESVEDTDLPPYLVTAWYVSGTWLVTGESKSGLLTPRRPVHKGGFGAVEVGIRYESFAFGTTAHDETPSLSPRARVIVGNRDRLVTLGVTWAPVRWVRVQFNGVRERLDDPAQGPNPGAPTFWSRVFRLQFAL